MAIHALITGDIHLGKRSAATSSREKETSTKYTWEKIVKQAINQAVDMLILSGDIVDRDNRFYEAIGPLQAGFKALQDAEIKVYVISGNHDFDVLPQILSMEQYPDVHLLGKNGNWESIIYTKNKESIQIIGWSFPKSHYELDPTANFDRNMAKEDIVTLALLHADHSAANSNYAPIHIEKLKNIPNIDAWILGHVHKPEIIHPKAPFMLYPGSPHALSPKEQGAHGPFELTIENGEIHYRQLNMSPVRYETITIDITGSENEDTFRRTVTTRLKEKLDELLSSDKLKELVIDLLFTGEHSNLPQIEKWGNAIETDRATIRKTSYDIRPAINIDSLLDNPSYIGIVANAIKSLEAGVTNEFTNRLLNEWKNEYARKTSTTAFSPLDLPLRTERELEEQAKRYILTECKRLLSELTTQLNHED